MSISYGTTVTPTSSNIIDALIDEANNYVRFIENTSNSLRTYDLVSGSQVGGNTTVLTSPATISLISNASAFIMSSTGANGIDLIELSSMHRQNYSIPGGTGTATTAKGQQSAGDIVNKIVMATSATANTIIKMDGNTFTRTALTIPMRGCRASSIIYKSANRWLVGTDILVSPGGMIFEIDASGNVVDSMDLTRANVQGTFIVSAANSFAITFMSYIDNFVLASTSTGYTYLIDWTTKTIIGMQGFTTDSSTNTGVVLSTGGSGICLASTMTSSGSYARLVFEIDATLRPYHVTNPFYSDQVSSSSCAALGFSSHGQGFIAMRNRINFLTITPRDSSTTTITIQDPPGTDVKGKLWLIQDDGVGSSFLLLETYLQSPATYRVPTGKTIRAVVKYDDGINAKYSMSVFNT